jgi:hypothetical protein
LKDNARFKKDVGMKWTSLSREIPSFSFGFLCD